MKILKQDSEQLFTGVSEDLRTIEEKNKDYQHEEIYGMAGEPYVWKEFDETKIPQYTKRNQNGSGMCGAFSGVKALGIVMKKLEGEYKDLLPPFVYQLRTNTSAGMNMNELFQILCKKRAPLDIDLRGDNLTETQANNFPITNKMYKEALAIIDEKYNLKYAFINPKDLDEIARVIDDGWTPIILLRSDISEWTSEPYQNPKFDSKVTYNINHYNPLIYAGKKDSRRKFVSDDSWGSSYGKNGQRVIDESFMLNRVELVGYIYTVEKENTKPKYSFNKILTYGIRESSDVKALQDVLKYENCIDKSIPSTGNYLNQTAQGIMKLQLKNKIASVSEIESLNGKRVGAKTLLYLKKYA